MPPLASLPQSAATSDRRTGATDRRVLVVRDRPTNLAAARTEGTAVASGLVAAVRAETAN